MMALLFGLGLLFGVIIGAGCTLLAVALCGANGRDNEDEEEAGL